MRKADRSEGGDEISRRRRGGRRRRRPRRSCARARRRRGARNRSEGSPFSIPSLIDGEENKEEEEEKTRVRVLRAREEVGVFVLCGRWRE